MGADGPQVGPQGLRAGRSPAPGGGGWPWFGRARWLLLLAGALAGLAAFGIGEFTRELIPPEKVRQNLMGSVVFVADRTTTTVADARNGAITYGVLGLCVAAGLGVAGGLVRRSTRAAIGAGVLGAVLGAALGGGVSFALLPRFIDARYQHFEYDLQIGLAMHAMLWGLLGAGAGLAAAVGLGAPGCRARAVAAGLIGAVLGSLAYDVLGAAFFAGAKTDQPISERWPTRLLACLLVSLGASIAVALSLPEPRPGDPGPESEPPAPASESPASP